MMTVTSNLAIKSVEVTGRVRLSYAEQGDVLGVPVVFLHGATDSWRSFERVLPHLPESIRAIALTQRGHGDSARPATGYRSRDLATDLAAFMDALDLPRAVIAGHCMGGSVAQRFALDYPERTQALVLASSFPTMRGNPDTQQLWDSAISTLKDPVDRRLVVEFQQSTLAQPVPEQFFEAVVQESLKVPARVWKDLFEGFLEEDFSGELNRIQVPTLIVWGDRDAFCSRQDQDSLTRALVTSKLIVYSETGHALHWEEPELFADDVVSFIEGLERE
jgi:pimeloyl-ACP methyl ester carboxylesterase